MIINKNKGITLIALVVTIVVLLILAGISINTLFGESGIINKADKAKDISIIAEEKDVLKMAYNAAVVEKLGDGISAEDLQKELDNSIGPGKTTVVDNGDKILNVCFEETKHYYNVDKGDVEKTNIATPKGKYVDLKTNLLKEDLQLEDGSNPSTDWRIFDSDEKYVYVILADYLPNSTGISQEMGLIACTTEATEFGVYSDKNRADLMQKLNGDWTPYIFSESNTQLDRSTVAKLSARGAATIEEWTKSWNSKYTKLYTRKTEESDNASVEGWLIGDTLPLTTYMISVAKSDGYKDTLYFPHCTFEDKCYGTWLASESPRSYSCLMIEHYGGWLSYYGYCPGTYFSSDGGVGVRPIVSIPIELLNDNNNDGILEIE